MTSTFDGLYKQTFKEEDGITYRELTQPSEDTILNRNSELRKNTGVINDMSFGRQLASIPVNAYEKMCRDHPELIKGDSQQRSECMMKILNSSEGKKYLVQ